MTKPAPTSESTRLHILLESLKWIVSFLIIVFVLSCGLASIAKLLDYANVVRRALDSLSPYAHVIPWFLITALAVYIIHFPRIRDAIVSLFERVEEMPGGWRLGPRRMSEDEIDRVAEVFLAKTKGRHEEEKVRSEHEREDYRKWLVMEKHIQYMDGTTNVPPMYEAVRWQYYDGCFRHGDEIVFMLVKRPQSRRCPHANLIGIVRQFDAVKAQVRRSRSNQVSLHVLFCIDESYPVPPEKEVVSQHLTGVRTDVSVYLYPFDKNDAIISDPWKVIQ